MLTTKNETIKRTEKKNSPGLLIMNLFVVAVFCIHPLVLDNAYFNVLETKYKTYCVMAIVMIMLMALYGVFSGRMFYELKQVGIRKLVTRLKLTDWAMIVFWLAHVLSWVFCVDWRWEVFWGTSGRYNGVFLFTIYFIVYFLVTRCLEFRKWHVDAFLVTGTLVCLLGIADYFQLDIVGLKANLSLDQHASFTSTLGNINTYTSYVAIVLALAMMMYATEKQTKRMMVYYVCMVVAALALIMGASDNAYLSFAALFGFSPLYLFRTKRGVSRYLISLASVFTTFGLLAWINIAFADVVLGVYSLFTFISQAPFFWPLVIALWGLAGGVVYMLQHGKNEDDSKMMGKWLVYAWMGVIVLVVAIAAFLVYDATFAGNADRYGMLANYVQYNDAWGSGRGYVWTRSLHIWSERMGLIQQLFGFGADCFGLLFSFFYSPDIVNGVTMSFDNTHNEYLNYLLTVGLVGVSAYIVFLFASLRLMWKRSVKRPELIAVMYAVLTYMTQALVNINPPIVVPVFFLLVFVGQSKVQD